MNSTNDPKQRMRNSQDPENDEYNDETEEEESEEFIDGIPASVNEMFFSFESAPVGEGWYSTYMRQARGEEILYYPASYSHPFQLPYEMMQTSIGETQEFPQPIQDLVLESSADKSLSIAAGEVGEPQEGNMLETLRDKSPDSFLCSCCRDILNTNSFYNPLEILDTNGSYNSLEILDNQASYGPDEILNTNSSTNSPDIFNPINTPDILSPNKLDNNLQILSANSSNTSLKNLDKTNTNNSLEILSTNQPLDISSSRVTRRSVGVSKLVRVTFNKNDVLIRDLKKQSKRDKVNKPFAAVTYLRKTIAQPQKRRHGRK